MVWVDAVEIAEKARWWQSSRVLGALFCIGLQARMVWEWWLSFLTSLHLGRAWGRKGPGRERRYNLQDLLSSVPLALKPPHTAPATEDEPLKYISLLGSISHTIHYNIFANNNKNKNQKAKMHWYLVSPRCGILGSLLYSWWKPESLPPF